MTRGTFYGIAASILVLDQATKWWAVSSLAGGETVAVIPGYLVFHLVHNRGAAFGMFPSGTLPLAVVAAVAVGVMVWAERRGLPGRAWALALGLLLGGAAGNLIDRLRLGYVIDFIELDWRGRNVWPVFNVADSAITVGTILLVWLLWRAESNDARQPGAVPARPRTEEEERPGARPPGH